MLGGASFRGKIAISCVALLGSVAIAGVTQVEITGKVFSSWAENIKKAFSPSTSSSVASGQPIQTSQVIAPFKIAGEEVIKVTTTYIWPTIASIPTFITSLKSSYRDWFEGIKNFFFSLTKSDIFKRVFENIHQKLWKVITFAVRGENRNKFIGLFSKEAQTSTITTLKFLSGLTVSGNPNFKARTEVFSFLLSEWMREPDKVTDKFERLSKEIDKWTKKFQGQETQSRGGASEDSNKYVYELDIASLKGYLEVQKGFSENLYKMLWLSAIISKMQTGQDLTFGTKSLASTLGSWVSWWG